MTNGKYIDLAAIALETATEAVALEKQTSVVEPDANIGAYFSGDQKPPSLPESDRLVATRAAARVERELGLAVTPGSTAIQPQPAPVTDQAVTDQSVGSQAAALVEQSLGLEVKTPAQSTATGPDSSVNVEGMTRAEFESAVKELPIDNQT